MLVFLDESGDAGFKFDSGSSSHFVIALVIFDDPLDAEETSLRIKKLRRELKVHEMFEFKFNKTDDFRRYQFLEAVRDAKFRVRAMVVDKRKLYSEHLKENKEAFYNYFVSEVMMHNHGRIRDAKLRVDGSGDRVFKQAFQAYLRGKLGENVVSQCRFLDSKKDSLIQLADMAAGAINRAYKEPKRDTSYLDKIRHKIENTWQFG